MTVTEHDELVAALLRVPGVAAATVEAVNGGPGTLRLQLVPGVDEVVVASEVNHLLRARFGLAVDTDRVRVVEPAPGANGTAVREAAPPSAPPGAPEPGAADESAAPRPDAASDRSAGGWPAATPQAPDTALADAGDVAEAASARLQVERVQLVSSGLTTTVVVTLRAGDRAAAGSAEGTATQGSLNRAVAAATLHAVEAVVDGVAKFDVEHVELAETGEHRTALVVVTMVTERATQRLSGASVVREDPRQAVIRAVLAAVNRRLEPILAK